MNWYYMDGDKQIGPVADQAMGALIKADAISRSTPVWREGMADWVDAGQTELAAKMGTPEKTATPPPFRAASATTATNTQPGKQQTVSAPSGGGKGLGGVVAVIFFIGGGVVLLMMGQLREGLIVLAIPLLFGKKMLPH